MDLLKNNTDYKRGGAVKVFKKNIASWVLLLPAVIMLYIVVWRPIAAGFTMSFFELKGYTPTKFIGFGNYINVFSDTLFIKTLFNTVAYVFWSLVMGYFLPVAIAIMINEVVHLKSFFKFTTYLPVMVPGIAASLIWYFLFLPGDSGVLNGILARFGAQPFGWLQEKQFTIPLIVFTTTWKSFGSTTIIYLAALQSIDQQLYEAASLDGAKTFSKIWHVTLPGIRTTMLLMLIQQIIGVFQIMTEPLAMTAGGPDNASLTLSLQGYYYAFTYFQAGNALALGAITFAILLVFTLFYFKLDKKFSD